MELFTQGVEESEFEFDIVINNLTTGDSLIIHQITPDTIGITPSAPNMNSVSILGRSSPASFYNEGNQRSLSFQLKLHRDIFKASSEKEASDNFQKLLDWFDALNYPSYTSSGVVPPNCYIRLGNATGLKGVATVTYSLDKPIDQYGRYMSSTVSFSLEEVLNVSWDATEIAEGCVSRKEISSVR